MITQNFFIVLKEPPSFFLNYAQFFYIFYFLYKGKIQFILFSDKRDDVTEEVPATKKSKRYNVTSRVQIRPTAEDDYADYTCEARHEALPPDMPLRVTVQLSVLCKKNNFSNFFF